MSFDPNLFTQTTNEGELSTDYLTVQESEYPAVVKNVAARQAKDSIILDVNWSIDDDAVREFMGRDEVLVRQSVFLEMTDNGTLDMGKGKNVQLGRLRQALGQNTGAPWSPNMLEGQCATIFVTERTVTTDKEGNELPEDQWKKYNDVKGVMPR